LCPNKKIGIVFGKFMLLQRWSIYYGGFAKDVYLPVCIYKKDVSLAHLSCPLCDQDNEDDWHVLCNCDINIQARQVAGLEQMLAPRLQQVSSIREVIHEVCSVEDKETARAFVMLMWVLWNNKNNRVWNDVNEPGRSLGLKARFLWDEWFAVQQLQHGMHRTEQQQQLIRWQKPSHGCYKCNVDAGFHKELNKTSTGWCLCDHMGLIVMAETTWMNGNCSIVEGESIVLLETLKVMEQRGISQVIF
jgi:hypothetical protein